MKKYELTDEVKTVGSKTHYRTKALRDIPRYNVYKGDLGGWISGEHNLSHEGDCWVAEDAVVSDDAIVAGDAYISGQAKVLDKARVTHSARVKDYALVGEDARVSGWAYIVDCACISGRACINGHAYVGCDARVFGYASVTGRAHVYCEAVIRDSTYVGGDVRILGTSIIKDDARVFGKGRINSSIVGGNAWLDGDVSLIYGATVEGDISLTASLTLSAEEHPIRLKRDKDIYVFKNNWSSGRMFCYLPEYKLWHVGCFTGTSDELIKKAYIDSKLSGDCYSAYVALVERLEAER